MKLKVLLTSLFFPLNDGFLFPSTQVNNKIENTRRRISQKLRVATLPDVFDITAEDAEEKSSDNFNWFKSWHPLVPVEYLDEEKPHSFKLLGMDIVVWNDGAIDKNPLFGSKKERMKGAKKTSGYWRVFVDQCPHRKVPLSQGRIEDDGSLLCSYHGWRFNGDGEAIDIPQISNEKSQVEAILKNPKSKCNSFPVQIVDGVLWVWPDSSEDSKIESALTKTPAMEFDEGTDPQRVWTGTWNFRELPYGHDFFIENVVDPAHVPISHHNVVGSRYEDQTLSLKSSQTLTKHGFEIQSITHNSTAKTTFIAPSKVFIRNDFSEDGGCQYLELLSSPSRPGFCNHVGRMVVVKDKNNVMPQLLKQFTVPLPKWVNHIASSSFLNQDALFLHSQERNLSHNKQYRSSIPGTSDDYASAILPISVDLGVLKYRTWLKKFAGGSIPFKGDIQMPHTSNEVVFDVWNAHTKHCKVCLAALKNLKTTRALSFFASILLATIRPKRLGLVGSTVGAFGFSALGFLLTKIIGMFYRYEFSHANNH